MPPVLAYKKKIRYIKKVFSFIGFFPYLILYLWPFKKKPDLVLLLILVKLSNLRGGNVDKLAGGNGSKLAWCIDRPPFGVSIGPLLVYR